MTATVSANLERWEAWAPGVETKSQWLQWALGEVGLQAEATPSVSFLPAMFRRRLSRFSKMALNVAYRCMVEEQTIHTVFSSRHGGLNTTINLLNEIVKGELISPTAFSMSVHNTVSGLYTIARKDQSPSSAIASGEDSLESGFLEAMALLNNGQIGKVLLVACDEPVPSPLNECLDEIMYPHAAAFLLSATPGAGPRLSLSIKPNKLPYQLSGKEPHTLSLIRFLLKQESELHLPGRRLVWRWKARIEET